MQEQDKDLLALKALAHDAKFSGTATAQGVLALWRYIEQQAARIEELERIARNATGYVKELESASSQAVDLSGLTRYMEAAMPKFPEAEVHDASGIRRAYSPVQMQAFAFKAMENLLSSAPVVREGKMTDEHWQSEEQAAFSAWAINAFPNESSQGLISLGSAWKQGQAFEREVLATGKGAEPVACRYKGSGGEWVIGHIVDKEKAAAYGCEFLYTSPFATPSTPSQAWEGELSINMNTQFSVTLTAYGARARNRHYAWMRDHHPDVAPPLSQAGDTITEPLWELFKIFGNGMSAGMPEVPFENNAIRSLSSNPVSLTEWPVGQVAKPEYKAEQQARNEAASARLEAVASLTEKAEQQPFAYLPKSELAKLDDPRVAGVGMLVSKEPAEHRVAIYLALHPASNGNGEKGGAA